MKNIFKTNSTTFYFSHLFFPKNIREQINILYKFVRTPDNYVDQIPQRKKLFLSFMSQTLKALRGVKVKNQIIQEFICLSNQYNIDEAIILKFLDSIKQDLKKKTYNTSKELDIYTNGSAEMIGLMIAKILNLPKISYPYAKKLGKSFQLINFLRDIGEDNALGRTYFPLSDLRKFNLKSLRKDYTLKHPEEFNKFINFEVEKILRLQKYAEQGFKYIPKKYLIAIKTASDMYKWTALEIQKDPFSIYRAIHKPTKTKVITQGLVNSIIAYLW